METNHRFYWVTLGATAEGMIEHQCLWAPQQKKGGQDPFFFWKSVSQLKPGDIVFGYFKGEVKYLGRVTGAPRSSSAPWSAGDATVGWLAPTEFESLEPAVGLERITSEVPELLGKNHGPLDAAGKQNQGYLYELSADIGRKILAMTKPTNTDKRPPLRPENIILYGPPGTGKTHATAKWAVKLAEGVDVDDMSDDEVYAQFHRLIESQRVAFVTFHQSMSYEEFVEGIRPRLFESTDSDDDGKISYEIRPGIFRQICHRAMQAGRRRADAYRVGDRTVWKMSLGRVGESIFDECIEGNVVRLGYGGNGDYTGADTLEAVRARLREAHPDPSSDFGEKVVHAFKNQIAMGDLIVVTAGNLKFRAVAEVTGAWRLLTTDRYRQARAVRWIRVLDEPLPWDLISRKPFTQSTLYELKPTVLIRERLEDFINSDEGMTDGSGDSDQAFVLIIDEINRGNVSRIFGELITLLEPDKRRGAPHALTVTLPYSQEPFEVPPNLHVVGTMNTADRSLAFLDTALRRRFRFIEIGPDSRVLRRHFGPDGMLDEVDTPRLLDALNRRIEVLLDRDHRLGHAYFMKAKKSADLRDIFVEEIIPLLLEYFHDDPEKVLRILGVADSGGEATAVRLAPIKDGLLIDLDIDDESAARFEINPVFRRAEGAALGAFFRSMISGKSGGAE